MPDMQGVLNSIYDSSTNSLRISAANDAFSIGAAAMQTAATIVTTNDVVRIQFPDGATTTAWASFTVPSTWTSCNIGIIYSGTSAGTLPIRWQMSIKKLDVFVDLITEAFASDQLLTNNTQATANQVAAVNVVAAFDVTQFALGDVYSVRIQRIGADAADTYTGTAEILGLNFQRA